MNCFTAKEHDRAVALRDGAEMIDFETEELLKLAVGAGVVLALGGVAIIVRAILRQHSLV